MPNRFKIDYGDGGFVAFQYDYDVRAWYAIENYPTRVYFSGDVCMEFYIPLENLLDHGAFNLTPFVRAAINNAGVDEISTVVVDYRGEFSLVNDLYDKIDLLNKLLYAIEHGEEYGYLLPATGLTDCNNWTEWFESILQPGHCYKFFVDCDEFDVVVNWKCAVRQDRLPDYKSLLEGKLVVSH